MDDLGRGARRSAVPPPDGRRGDPPYGGPGIEPDGPRGGRRGRLLAAAAVLLAGLLAGHRAVPNVRGVGSLLDSVTPLLGAGVPLLALGALLRRSRLALVALLLPAAVWAATYAPAWLRPTAGGGPLGLRVASQNLRAGNPDPAATVRELAAAGADVIALQEVPVDGRVSAALRGTHPHHAVVSTVALYSRYPVRDPVGVDTGLGWTRALRAVVAAPDGDLAVYVVHLGSARAGDTATRDQTVAALAGHLRTDAAPRLVVLGDLNTASTDRVFAPLVRVVRDAQADAGRGFGFTWPAAIPVTRPDHVLYRGLTATSAGVLRTPDSDHRAVTASFRW